jgi:hypothetical protein
LRIVEFAARPTQTTGVMACMTPSIDCKMIKQAGCAQIRGVKRVPTWTPSRRGRRIAWGRAAGIL